MADNEGPTLSMEIPISALQALKGLKRITTERYRRIYANNIMFEFTAWDASMIFGEVIGADEDGNNVVEQVAHVTMAPAFAKAVVGLLMANISAYEKQFGEIRVPELTIGPVTPNPLTEEKGEPAPTPES